MPDFFGEAISYNTGVDSADRSPFLNTHFDSPNTSSVLLNAEATDNGIILQEQHQLTNIVCRRGYDYKSKNYIDGFIWKKETLIVAPPRDSNSIRGILRFLITVTKQENLGASRKGKNI